MPAHTSPATIRKRNLHSKAVLTPPSPGTSDTDTTTAYHSRPVAALATAFTDTCTLESKTHRHYKSVHSRRSKFSPRVSPLSNTETSLRGFITFFWVGIAWYTIYTLHKSFRENQGALMNPEFLVLLGHDGWRLFVADSVLILSCGVCVGIVSLVKHGIIGTRIAKFVGGVWALSWFVGWMVWIWGQDWRWTQTGFITLHCIAMLMKQHSYLASNWEMFWKRDVLKAMHVEIMDLECDAVSLSPVSSNGSTVGDVSISSVELEEQKVVEGKVAVLKNEIDLLKAELQRGVGFPANITILNFVDYMLVPSLVYELHYPRTERFNLFAFFERTSYTFLSFFLLCTTVDQYILPTLQKTPEMDFVTTVITLIMPFMVCFMMIFFIIFECICNAFAELTCFSDREFYQDWWNSCTFDEYARRWNKPVHEFLLRHVYLESISSYKISKQNAAHLTFFVSSLFHEFAIAMIGKRVRPWLFLFQMFQIPLIWMSRLDAMKRRRGVGNVLFWFSMFLGPPLLAVLYAREHFLES
ncbi:MBOAT, membrane-bound O-acyltransferase family-domain-containing protein [Obelidium mucronatum]|nr:MBOAT, membrane-bound O-acyltransferase family-domain-containing protein [Obelidium mucronatum]